MRRSLTVCLAILCFILAGCGGGGGSGNAPAPTGAVQTSSSSGSTPAPSPTQPAPTTLVLTTPSSTITIPATVMTAPMTATTSERTTPLAPLPNRTAELASPVIELSSPSAPFTDGATITVSITPNGSATPNLLVITQPSGGITTVHLPSETGRSARAPTAINVDARWLGLPGRAELALYRLITGTNRLGLFTDDPTTLTSPTGRDRYTLVFHGFNQNHDDIEPLRLLVTLINWAQSVISVEYDETQAPDVIARSVVEQLKQPTSPLFFSTATLQLVGYSYGGLVARAVAEELRSQDSPLQVDSTITIVTPNKGAPIASNLLTGLALTLSNGRGRLWLPTTPALRTLDGSDGVLLALARAPRAFAWTAIGGTAFPTLPPTTNPQTETLRFIGNLIYPNQPHDGLVAGWSALPVLPVLPRYERRDDRTRHHLSVLSADNLAALCRTIVTPFGAGRTRISRGSNSAPLGGFCYVERGQPSYHGRYIVYESDQTDNVADDTNSRRDVFCYDQVTGATELVSVLSDESQMNGTSQLATVSADGRFVVFSSSNSRSLTGETLRHWNVYLRDRFLETTTCLTVNQFGGEIHPADAGGSDRLPLGLAMTPDARVIVYAAVDQIGFSHIVHFDRTTGIRQFVDVADHLANGYSSRPTIADDGMRVCFQTLADNLGGGYTPGTMRNVEKIYARDLATQTTRAVSVRPDGTGATDACELATISGDGSAVVFSGRDPFLVSTPIPANSWPIFVRRLNQPVATATRVASVDGVGAILSGYSNYPSLDRRGRYVAFNYLHDNPFGTRSDVVLVDLATGRSRTLTTDEASQPSNGLCYWPTLSGDGSYLHFASYATTFDSSNLTPIVQDYVVTNPLLLPTD